MRKSIPLKIAVAGAGLVMAGGVAAAAVTTPDQASDGLEKATTQAGFEVPTSGDVQPLKAQAPTDDEVVEEQPTAEETEGLTETEETDDTAELEDESTGPVDNHGAAVTEYIETSELTGKEFGQGVSEVARSDAGKPEQATKQDAEEAPNGRN